MSSNFFNNGVLAMIQCGDSSGSHTQYVDIANASIKAALVRNYTFDPTDMDLSEITGAGGVVVAETPYSITCGASTAIEDVSGTDHYVSRIELSDINFDSIAAGSAATCLLVYQAGFSYGDVDFSTDAEKMLLLHFDDITGLPYTPVGDPVSITFGPTKAAASLVLRQV